MKIKNGFVCREIAGQSVVIALGDASKVFNGMIKLNETGRILWDMLSEGAEKEDLVARLQDTYDADRSILEADCERFIQTLQEKNILEA